MCIYENNQESQIRGLQAEYNVASVLVEQAEKQYKQKRGNIIRGFFVTDWHADYIKYKEMLKWQKEIKNKLSAEMKRVSKQPWIEYCKKHDR